MKAIEQNFHVVLFIMLYKVVLTFKSVNETLVFDHSDESFWAVLSCGTVYHVVQGGSNLKVCGWNPSVWQFKWKPSRSTLNIIYCVVPVRLAFGLNPCVWPFQLKLSSRTFTRQWNRSLISILQKCHWKWRQDLTEDLKNKLQVVARKVK